MQELFERIREEYRSHFPEADASFVERVRPVVQKAYAGQKRLSGEPYLTHALNVALTVARMGLGQETLMAAWFHDAPADGAWRQELGDLWTPTVKRLVENLNRLRSIRPQSMTPEEHEGYRRMVLAVGADLRAVLVRVADRLDNMRTLSVLSPAEQQRLALEARHVFAPLANRLGLQSVKSELENLAFSVLEPEAYARLDAEVREFERSRAHYVEEVVAVLKKRLAEMDIPAVVYGRPKHLYSIHLKMQDGGKQLEDIHDLIGFRILVDTPAQCYGALGLVHSLFKPVEGRFKDYIAVPKPNGYQSLHTTVLGPRSRRVEIQIRTHHMHEIAEKGVAAHWFYKERRQKTRYADGAALAQVDLHASDDAFWSLEQYQTEVFVFTPQGRLVVLPIGSCPVDFAFMVHSAVGMHCVGARVNGQMVPLRTQLRTMDTVEILTSAGQWPKADWLKFVVTSKARGKIRSYLNQVERERLRLRGRELLEKEFKRRKISLSRFLREEHLPAVLEELKVQSLEDLLLALGEEKITLEKVLAFVEPVAGQGGHETEKREERPKAQPRRISGPPIEIDGLRNVLVKLALCCHPVPGEEIVGFVTRAQGVSVHRQDCPRVAQLEPGRLVQARWILDAQLGEPVRLRVVTADRPGILAQLSEVFAQQGVNIRKITTEVLRNGRTAIHFHFTASKVQQEILVRNLKRVKGVHSASR